jgi:drug/metabolite transporter (DMT)-like permease
MKMVYFILLALFWGGSFLAINLTLKGFSPFLAATLRVSTAIVLIFAFILWKKVKLPEKRIVIQTLLNGALGVGLPWALLFWGEQFVQPALCSIINATTPIFVVIFAAHIIRSAEDSMTWNKWLGVVLGFIGIAVIFGPYITGGQVQSIEGLVAVVGMALCYASFVAWLKRLSPHLSNSMSVFLSCTGALIVLLPITIYYGITKYFLTGAPLFIPSLAALYLGIFSTAIAFLLFFKLLKEVGTVQASAVTYLVPIVSISLDWLVLDKWIGNHALFGALIVFAALRMINKPTPRYID